MSLRDRKRARTRRAIVDAATELFERNGYDQTTVADIAAAADIGTRTFFSYFASKEEVLFPESDGRVRAVVEAIASRKESQGPAEILLRALHTVGTESDDMTGRVAELRTRLIQTVPAVRSRALSIQHDGQQEIARRLAEAFPEQLDEVGAAALTGAFVGAINAALQVVLSRSGHDDPAARHQAIQAATDLALKPWTAMHRLDRALRSPRRAGPVGTRVRQHFMFEQVAVSGDGRPDREAVFGVAGPNGQQLC